VFVKIVLGDQIGVGEGTELDRFTGGTSRTMEEIINSQLAPLLMGLSLEAAFEVFRREIMTYPHNPGAKLGLEMALYDLWGKQRKLPLYELLGGRMRKKVPLCAHVGALSVDRALETARQHLAAGFTSLKLKADGDIPRDIERIQGILDLLPPNGKLRVDANQGWVNFNRAGQVLREVNFSPKLEYIEQPVLRERIGDLRKISDAFGFPVFADEAVETPLHAMKLLEKGLVDGLSIKLAKCGSIADGVLIANMAAIHNVPVTPVCAYATTYGATAELHLAAVAPILSSGAELIPHMLESDPAGPTMEFKPSIPVPERPGVGADLELDI
jgi:L-Ala-D/L-Glu epimerase